MQIPSQCCRKQNWQEQSISEIHAARCWDVKQRRNKLVKIAALAHSPVSFGAPSSSPTIYGHNIQACLSASLQTGNFWIICNKNNVSFLQSFWSSVWFVIMYR